MDAFEKVLNGLIDSMHKHIAKGNGEKKVSVAKELEKVSEVEEKKEEPKAEAEEKKESSAFDKFLMQARANKPKPKSTEMNFASKKQPQLKDKKKAK